MQFDPFLPYPFILLVTVFGLLYLGLRAHQTRNLHRERLAAIEKGVDLKPILVGAGITPAFAHRLYLLRGLVWIAAGVTLFGVLAVTAPVLIDRGDPSRQLEARVLRFRHLRELSATDAQIEAMEKEIARREAQRPNPAVLGALGLVPIGIGIAYLIFYALEERRTRALPPPAG